jgi:hypothetical protein
MMISQASVIWIGVEPNPNLQREFTDRDLVLQHWQHDKFDPDDRKVLISICQAKGVFILHNREKPSRTMDFLRCVTSVPVAYSGVLPYILVENLSDTRVITGNPSAKVILDRYPISYFDISQREHYPAFAQTLVRHNPVMVPNLDLAIRGDTSGLNEIDKVLLQRSFSDCGAILLQNMEQGKSAKVFRVYPEFLSDPATGYSLPFIVKLDKQHKVEREKNNYQILVKNSVPHNLRPWVDFSRCFCDPAREYGIFVANFVDRAIPLLDAINRGAGPVALNSLFEDALGRWFHKTEKKEGEHPFQLLQAGNPSEDRFVESRFSEKPEVFTHAVSLGAVLKPTELLTAISKIPCDSYLHGKSHKDLHAKNVLVKGSDAIVIDFARSQHGPILLDLATLEVSIAFDSVPADRTTKTIEEWNNFVDEAFAAGMVQNLPRPKEGFEPFARHWACIRQIRRLVLSEQTNKYEYTICLAIELLRRSMFVDDGICIAGHAYYLADRLVRSLSSLR